MNFTKFLKKTELPEKFKLLNNSRIKLTGKRKKTLILAPWPTTFYKLSMTSTVWNISIGQLRYLSGYAPSQLAHACSLAECKKPKKVLDFLATTENISYQHSSHTTSKTQQLLRRKLTLSQLKTGQVL